MSTISTGTTTTTGYVVTSDTSGELVIKTGSGAGTIAMTIDAGQNVALTNALDVAYGGTGLTATPTNGQLLIGNGTGYTLATITAGSGISVTNASGSITITNSSTGGAQDYIVQSYGIV